MTSLLENNFKQPFVADLFSAVSNDICSLPGRARRCLSDFVAPFARSEVVQGGCDRYYDERWRKREIEIFSVDREYQELAEVLDVERDEKLDLPCDVIVMTL